GQRIWLTARLARRHVSAAMQLSLRDALSYVLHSSERRRHIPGDHSSRALYQSSSISSTMQRVRDSAYLALRSYHPRFYPGNIKFVRAQISTDFPDDPAAVWA